MAIGLSLVFIVLSLIFFKVLSKIGFMIPAVLTVILTVGATVWICLASPKLHKPFELNVIEYFIKINDDGSTTTTKKTTTTVLGTQQK